ncbi:MAG: histidine phosphatase family protein [Bacteroidales bacterium]|jgi:phosphohistidine phosphatase|nr:histidine phosphatase family protein [Bacteroidales bacterium]MDD3701020.1 histidine phosphatase family protein [Bacteroidales bacterium]MDY0370248.1 histidine phosphatase family protein [Bacteroidales bacterium]
MKHLCLIRHAEASTHKAYTTDHERKLTNRGIKQLHQLIDFLNSQAFKPELIVSSSAVRAKETSEILVSGLGSAKDIIHIEPIIYSADDGALMKLLTQLPDHLRSVVIVGHNPTITDVANRFLQPAIHWLPTSSVTGISFETERWQAFSHSAFSIKWLWFPTV